jgi:hypothetical protein|tara:strand:+ start:367 stop:585 length:219 start_codon:yes stop_codon:yes gene_type:complete
MTVFDQVYNELTLLQQEDKDDLEIAEQALNAAMIFTMTNAPSNMNGIMLISHTFHGIITEFTLKEIEMGKEI